MNHQILDRKKLIHFPLKERKNLIDITKDKIEPQSNPPKIKDTYTEEQIHFVAEEIKKRKNSGKKIVMAFGAHTIKNGLSPIIINLLKQKWIDHIATNGAGIIHDWEFAYQGKSSEDVKTNVNEGKFGMWEETGLYLNLAITIGSWQRMGYGEAIGKMIENDGLDIPSITKLQEDILLNYGSNPEKAAASADLLSTLKNLNIKSGKLYIPHPYKEYSVQALAYRLNIPFTAHPMFGHDIIYTHPASCGAAIGRTAEKDFLSFAYSISNIDGGVYLSIGSAVMSPMIFEKSMSMAQNLAIQNSKKIANHLIVVVDLLKNEWDWTKNGEPPKDNPAYYIRHCKSFSRMGGKMVYINIDNRMFFLWLHKLLQS